MGEVALLPEMVDSAQSEMAQTTVPGEIVEVQLAPEGKAEARVALEGIALLLGSTRALPKLMVAAPVQGTIGALLIMSMDAVRHPRLFWRRICCLLDKTLSMHKLCNFSLLVLSMSILTGTFYLNIT